MALNFPIPTTVGQVYQDPTSGNTYVCTSLGPPAQWVGSGSSTSLDGTYLRKDASNDPVTGNLILEPSTNVNSLLVKQTAGNTTPAIRVENNGTGNSIEVDSVFSVSSGGVVTIPAGTVTSPAISPAGDSNTGIYFPAADEIALTANGTEAARITSQGIVDYYNKSNILGTVTQSGGVPTGAVIEYGSNTNGSFIKYADGTMICWRYILHTFASTATPGRFVLNLPSEFISSAYSVSVSFSPNQSDGFFVTQFFTRILSSTQFDYRAYFSSASTSLQVTYQAIGRWY